LVYRPVAHEEGDKDHVPDPSQTNIETYLSPSARSTTLTPNLFTVHIIDTKTRKRPSLPLDEDMLPSRLQLMLYHRLLSKLISTNAPFDFMIFWQLVNVNPEQQLSWTFLEQTGLIAEKDNFQVLNLADLSALWHDRVYQLHVAGVDDQLKLVYRLQVDKKGIKQQNPPSASAEATPPPKRVCQAPKDKDPKQETDCVNLITAGKFVTPLSRNTFSLAFDRGRERQRDCRLPSYGPKA
jgi:exonuclease V